MVKEYKYHAYFTSWAARGKYKYSLYHEILLRLSLFLIPKLKCTFLGEVTHFVFAVNCVFWMLTLQCMHHPRRSRVSRSGWEKRWDKSFQVRWKSPWVPALTELFPKIQVNAGSWLGKKNVLYYILCPIGEQFLLSSFWDFIHDGYCLAILARFIHQACACKANF